MSDQITSNRTTRSVFRRRRPVPLPLAALEAIAPDSAFITTVPGRIETPSFRPSPPLAARSRVELKPEQVTSMAPATCGRLILEARLRESIGHYGPEAIPADLAPGAPAAGDEVA